MAYHQQDARLRKRARVDVAADKHNVGVGVEKVCVVHVVAHVLDKRWHQEGYVKSKVGAAHKVGMAGLHMAGLFGGAQL